MARCEPPAGGAGGTQRACGGAAGIFSPIADKKRRVARYPRFVLMMIIRQTLPLKRNGKGFASLACRALSNL